jgi:hypothetical protein
MHNAYIVTGTLADSQTVRLDEALPLTSTRVRLVVEPIASVSAERYREVMADIRQRQQARGHQPANRAQVDSYVRSEREDWE